MFLIFLPTLLIVYLFYELYWKRRNYPPGPTPLPYFGNLLEIFKKAPGYQAHIDWTKEFGPVYTFWLGNIPTVAVTDYETLKESFIKDGENYAGKFSMANMAELYRGGKKYGIIDNEGDHWREQRRFTLSTLRDFGLGRNLMEEKILIEVDSLLNRLSASSSNVDIRQELDIAVGSIINGLLFGYRYDDERMEEFFELKQMLSEQMKDFGNPFWFMMVQMQWLRFLPGFKGLWTRIFSTRDALYEHFRNQIEVKRRETDFTTDVKDSNDYVEAYLKEQRKRQGEREEGGYSDIQLVNVVNDLWSAGLETTSTTLTWGIVYILNYPDVAHKIHRELDTVIQSDRKITLADKNSLPYLNATIQEIQRLANLLPQNLPHRNHNDVVLGGHHVPKGTAIVPQISAVLFDEKVFPEPFEFKPERFLNQDGTLRKVDEFVPFSIGKRQCLGEGLAKMELFLFFANIMQRFKISSDTVPSMEKVVSFTVQPKPFKCFLKERK